MSAEEKHIAHFPPAGQTRVESQWRNVRGGMNVTIQIRSIGGCTVGRAAVALAQLFLVFCHKHSLVPADMLADAAALMEDPRTELEL